MAIEVLSNFNNKNRSWYLTASKTTIPAQAHPQKTSLSKRTADTIASGLWLTAVGFAIYKTGAFRNKSPENILSKAKSIERKYSRLENIAKINDTTNLDKLLENKNGFRRFFIKHTYKFGEKFFNLKAKMGDELYNNMINSFGKMLIMPLVICASPFGNKETSNKEKTSLIIREPLSVLATFTLQGAFDKIFDIYMPKILESNMFENDKIKQEFKETGKVSISNFDSLKYNPKAAKNLFVQLTEVEESKGGLKNLLSKENAKKMITLDAFEPENYESYVRNFEKLISEGIVKPEHIEAVKGKFKTVTDCIGNYELAKVKPKIAMNILVVVILSRIFLNVIHGKTVKLLRLNEEGEKDGKNTTK